MTKAADKITVEVLKKYSDLPPAPSTESREDVLVLMVKNLRIYIHITQADKSPDDWGNGGSEGQEPGKDDQEMNGGDVQDKDWETDTGGGIEGGGKLD